VFDARDVTVLRPSLPALPVARLRRALPGLLEDQLLQDVQSCAFALSRVVDAGGTRAVAVIDRDWLETVVQAFERRGVRVNSAQPAQALRPSGDGSAFLLCVNDGVLLGDGQGTGLGLTAGADTSERARVLQALLSRGTVTQTLQAYAEGDGWDAALALAAKACGISIERRPLPLVPFGMIDLLDSRRGRGALQWLSERDWRAWRPALALASVSGLIALVGLNLQAWQMRAERDTLRVAIENRFRQSFPTASVMVDPVLQMQRQVAQLRTAAGQQAGDDFLPLISRFAQILGNQAADAVASIDYREGRLRVRFRGALAESRATREALVEAGRRMGLRVQLDAEREPGALVSLLR
jgi:general secretion pathway protein L